MCLKGTRSVLANLVPKNRTKSCRARRQKNYPLVNHGFIPQTGAKEMVVVVEGSGQSTNVKRRETAGTTLFIRDR